MINSKKIDSLYPVSTIGLVISLAYIFYVEVIQEYKIDLDLNILSEISVINLNEEVDDVQISYGGQDLLKDSLELKVFIIRVINSGDVPINSNMYDQEKYFGFKVSGGTGVFHEVCQGDWVS